MLIVLVQKSVYIDIKSLCFGRQCLPLDLPVVRQHQSPSALILISDYVHPISI